MFGHLIRENSLLKEEEIKGKCDRESREKEKK